MDNRKYSANGSGIVSQGDNHSNSMENVTVNVGNTHEVKSEPVKENKGAHTWMVIGVIAGIVAATAAVIALF